MFSEMVGCGFLHRVGVGMIGETHVQVLPSSFTSHPENATLNSMLFSQVDAFTDHWGGWGVGEKVLKERQYIFYAKMVSGGYSNSTLDSHGSN